MPGSRSLLLPPRRRGCGRLHDWACDYDTYLERREASLTAESAQRARFDKRLAEEETWIRRGVKARRTRDEGRVRALERMREERRARREQVGTVRMQAQRAVPSGRLVVEALGVEVGYGDRPVIRDFSTTTLLLVSHDRAFLNNVVTSTLVIDANGTVAENVGGYDDWLKQRGEGVPPGTGTTPSPRETPRPKREGPRKLSFKERRELSELPGRIRDAETGIAALEAERDELQRSMADPAFYRQDGARVAQGRARLEAVQTEIEEAYHRWESLEASLRELEAIEAKPPGSE